MRSKMLNINGQFYDGIIRFKGKYEPDVMSVTLKKERKDFYENEYPYDSLKTLKNHQFQKVLNRFFRFFKKCKNILEIGSGDGTFVESYQSEFGGGSWE